MEYGIAAAGLAVSSRRRSVAERVPARSMTGHLAAAAGHESQREVLRGSHPSLSTTFEAPLRISDSSGNLADCGEGFSRLSGPTTFGPLQSVPPDRDDRPVSDT